jgi:hypothetical protein
MASEATGGAAVNFEQRSYHCANLTAQKVSLNASSNVVVTSGEFTIYDSG